MSFWSAQAAPGAESASTLTKAFLQKGLSLEEASLESSLEPSCEEPEKSPSPYDSEKSPSPYASEKPSPPYDSFRPSSLLPLDSELPLPPPIPAASADYYDPPSTPTSSRSLTSFPASPRSLTFPASSRFLASPRPYTASPVASSSSPTGSSFNSCAFSRRFSPTLARAPDSLPPSPSSKTSSRVGSRAASPNAWLDFVDQPKKSKAACRRSVISMKTLLPLSLPSGTSPSSSSSSSATTPTSATTMASSSTSATGLGPSHMSSSSVSSLSSSSRLKFGRKRYDGHNRNGSLASHTLSEQRQKAGSPLAYTSDDNADDLDNEESHVDPVIPDFDFCNLPEMLARDLELSSGLFESRNLSSGLPMTRLAAERLEDKGRPAPPSLKLRGSMGSRSDRIGSPSVSSPRSMAMSNPLARDNSPTLDDTASETSRSEGGGDDMEGLYVHQSAATAATSTVSDYNNNKKSNYYKSGHYKSDSVMTPLSPARSLARSAWAQDDESEGHKVLVGRPESRSALKKNQKSSFSNPFGKPSPPPPQTPVTRPKKAEKRNLPDYGHDNNNNNNHNRYYNGGSRRGSEVQQNLDEDQDTFPPTPSRTTSIRTARARAQRPPSRTPSIYTQPADDSPPPPPPRGRPPLILKPIPKPDERRRERKEMLEPKSQRTQSLQATPQLQTPQIQTPQQQTPQQIQTPRQQAPQLQTPQREWDTLSSDSLPAPRVSTSSRVVSPSKSASTLPPVLSAAPATPRVTVSVQTWLEASMAPQHKRNLSDEYPGLRPGAMPLPPDVLDTLRFSVSCFPETMLLTDSLSVDTIRSYSRKFKRPAGPISSSTFDSFKSVSSTSATPPPQPKKWTWSRILAVSKKAQPQLTGIGPDTRLDPERQRTEARPPWMALKNVFTNGATDYLCDALYAHVIVYNYVNAVCSRLTPPNNNTTPNATTTRPRPESRTKSRSSSVSEYDFESDSDSSSDSDNADDDGDDAQSNEIPRKAANILGLATPAGARGMERKTSIAVLREALAANTGATNARAREGERERMTEATVRQLHAGLGKCIARLVATMRCPEEERFADRLLVEEPSEVDVLFLRSVCEIVRCVEETQG